MSEWTVTGGVFLRSHFKGSKRESRGDIFRRYPPHEPAQAIVLACILRHVGATHDDIAHRKLPRWYGLSFYYCTLRCGLHAPGLNARPSLARGFNGTPFEKGISSLRRETSRAEIYVPDPERETWKLCPKCNRSEYTTSRFNPVRILRSAWHRNLCRLSRSPLKLKTLSWSIPIKKLLTAAS